MDAVPWISIVGYGSGWAIAGGLIWLFGRLILTGRFYSSEVVDRMQIRIDSLEAQNKDLIDQNSLLLHEGLPAMNAFFNEAKRQVER